ncbi:MAG TPA: lysophospholipid acyltransferase family protein [Gemmatimonadaceae bacterium]|nr:lysophospholipid acyltransferase family protein [Gemmatimonadaceae bacterium]
MYVPELGPAVPRRGNAISRWIGRAVLQAGGFKFKGEVPDEPKFVIIVVPHTSNWDFIVGVGALFALGFRISFLGKHTLFKWPLGTFMRWLGGIPVERSVSRDRVGENISAFRSADKMILAVAPEGTRKLVKDWKTGFYHVAEGARVPIVPVAFDYGSKTIELFLPFWTTGEKENDIRRLKDLYREVIPKNPENFQL